MLGWRWDCEESTQARESCGLCSYDLCSFGLCGDGLCSHDHMAYIGMANVAMACIVMANVVMAYIVMAYALAGVVVLCRRDGHPLLSPRRQVIPPANTVLTQAAHP